MSEKTIKICEGCGIEVKEKKVTEEFIKRWNETLLSGYKLENIHGKKDYSFALEMMLREAGVEVEGKEYE